MLLTLSLFQGARGRGIKQNWDSMAFYHHEQNHTDSNDVNVLNYNIWADIKSFSILKDSYEYNVLWSASFVFRYFPTEQ